MIHLKELLPAVIAIGCAAIMLILVGTAMKKDDKKTTLTTIQPMDLTITYCDSCKRCSSDMLEDILTQECEDKDMEAFI